MRFRRLGGLGFSEGLRFGGERGWVAALGGYYLKMLSNALGLDCFLPALLLPPKAVRVSSSRQPRRNSSLSFLLASPTMLSPRGSGVLPGGVSCLCDREVLVMCRRI